MNNPDISKSFFDELKKLSSKVKNETMVLLRTVNCHIDVDKEIYLTGRHIKFIHINYICIDLNDVTIKFINSNNESDFMGFNALNVYDQISLYTFLWNFINNKSDN